MKNSSRNTDLKDLVNRCITQTLTRSIYTSLTTFVMVTVLYVMGVSSIKEFALPLMAGIVCGAYSSVCITGALWYVCLLYTSHPGAVVGPKGWAVRPLKRYASWVQNVVRQFGPYPAWA